MTSRLLVLNLLACVLVAEAAPSRPLSAEELFRAAPLGEARLSPDGQSLGVVVEDGIDSRSLVIYDLKDFSPLALRGSGEFDIAGFRWISNDKVVFSLAFDKMYTWGLYSAQVAHLGDYSPIDKYNLVTIVGIPESRPGRVLAWLTGTVGYQFKADMVVELDADFKPRNKQTMQRGDAIRDRVPMPDEGTPDGWWADQHGEIALCRSWSKGHFHLLRYVPARKTWSEVPVATEVMPMGMDYDDQCAWVVTYAPAGGFALRRCHLDTGVLEAPVLQDPAYDISNGHLCFSSAARRLAGVIYQQSKPRSAWFLKPYAVAQASIDKLHPDTDNVLADHDRADKKFVYMHTGAQHPGTHELLDLEAKKVRGLGDAAPWLKDRPLHPVQPIYLKTRDGVALENYLALPEGASPAHPVPLVVLAHGGPWVRDTGEFNPEVQFLVSRGYAVLQPNYRGSSGYAPAISRERKYNFIRMHDDVTDATKALLATGIIDPRRVAIMGGSFGGYLAVAGVSREPGLYCCAITICGVFDWKEQIEHFRKQMP
ncbi:MAG: alpha/beta hydrolase family protein, partial [Opitutales bacterium]